VCWKQEPPDKLTTGEASRAERESHARAVGAGREAGPRARRSGLLRRADYARAVLRMPLELEHSNCERSELLNEVNTAAVLWRELSTIAANGALISRRHCPRKRRAKRAVQNIQKGWYKLNPKRWLKTMQL
jgi:hypothetical protein